MKKIFISYLLKSFLIIVIFSSMTPSSNAQQTKAIDSGFVPVNGIKVYYEVYGAGQPIVLLHGAFMTIQDNWGQLIPELSKTRKVIAMEMQGHGHTAYSDRKLSLANMSNDVEAVMTHLKVDSADIVGYSMGGAIAYQLITHSPKRVKKMVIISGVYKSTGWNPEIAGAFKNMKPEMFDNSPLKTGYDAVAPDKTKWPKFIAQMLGFIAESFDLGDSNIAKITSPVLIISGDNDGMDKAELGRTYKLLGGGVSADMAPMPQSHLAIVPSQSHVTLMMQSNTILTYLADFLK